MIASLLVMALAAGMAAQTGRPAADDAAVRDVVKRYVDARERRDGPATGVLFTSDADQLTSSGEWRKGRDEIIQGTLASSKRTAGTRTIAVESVRFAGPDTAIADGRYEISGGTAATRRMWTTFILARSKEGWRIAAIRNMLPAPAQP
jgi:uncharacterized protein (TIGR02246 family)